MSNYVNLIIESSSIHEFIESNIILQLLILGEERGWG